MESYEGKIQTLYSVTIEDTTLSSDERNGEVYVESFNTLEDAMTAAQKQTSKLLGPNVYTLLYWEQPIQIHPVTGQLFETWQSSCESFNISIYKYNRMVIK